MIYCPLCGTTNRRGSKYCNECGVKFDPSMQSKCPGCGALNAISDALCSDCGEPLVPAPLEEGLDIQAKPEEGEPQVPRPRSGTPSWLDGFPPIVAHEVPSEVGTKADRVEAAREWLRQTSFGPDARQKTNLLSGAPPEEGRSVPAVPGAIAGSSRLLAGIQDPLPASSLLAQPPLAARSSSTESSLQADKAHLAIQLEAAHSFSQIVALAGSEAGAGNSSDGASLPGSDRATGVAPPGSMESMLAIDYGSTQTRTFLIGLVEDEYRLIAWAEAPSTWGPPWHDGAVSAWQGVERMAATTGLRILDEQGQILVPEGQPGGVDAVVSTTSASSPLRLILVAPTQQTPLESAQHALPHCYATIEGLVTAHKGQGDVLIDDLEGQVRLVQELAPDAIVVLGSEDGDAGQALLASLETMDLACASLQPVEGDPPVIYVGNGSSRPVVEQIAGASTRLRVVDDLQSAVKELQLQRQMQNLPGCGTPAAWGLAKALPTASALAYSTQYLARYAMSDQDYHPAEQMANVLTVDVGGMTTAAAVVLDGLPELFFWHGLGTSHSISGILNHVALESVLRWLPSSLDATEARNILFGKELHPHTLPQTIQDLFLEQAVTREILGWISTAWVGRQKAGGGAGPAPQFDLIVGTGGVLGNAPSPGMAALMLLDGLQPVGISRLALDRSGLMASAGAIASTNPLAAVQLVERDALTKLGTVVAPMGTVSEGQVALSAKIEYEDGRAMEVSASFGSLEVLPLPEGQRATLEIRPAPRFALPGAPRGRALLKDVEGGTLGVIIDVRGRPLPRAEDAEEQRARMQRWLSNLGAQGPW